MSLAITHSTEMKSAPEGATPVSLPQSNVYNVYVVSQGRPLLNKGDGVLNARTDETKITLFGFGEDTLPALGAIVTIWGFSPEHGHFLLPNAKCTAHGTGILKGSATFLQVLTPPEEAGIPPFNARASVASEYGLLILKDGNANLQSNVGATEITVSGFGEDNLPPVGAVMKIWGVSYAHGPYFLPNAKCIAHGAGLLKGSATFVQVIAPPQQQEVGVPRFNAFELYVTRDGQPLMKDGGGVINFLFGGTTLTAYGFAPGKLPEIDAIVSIAGVSLDRGHFFLSSARCTSHGGDVLKNSATFVQTIVGPEGK